MENSTFWKSQEIEGIELLKASFLNFEFKRHWHDELSIGIIEQGAEGLSYQGSNVTIGKNQIVAINPSETHTGYAASEQGWTYRMFYFSLDLLENHLEGHPSAHSPFIKAPVLDDPKLFNQLQTLHISLEGNSLNLSKQSLLCKALEQLFIFHSHEKRQPDNCAEDKHSIIEIHDYLLDNWQKNINLSDLEAISGLNKYLIIRQFQKRYSVPPHQFLLLTKVARAKRLLLSGANCATVALNCGFYDQSHFTRNFKLVVGVSPISYKQNMYQ